MLNTDHITVIMPRFGFNQIISKFTILTRKNIKHYSTEIMVICSKEILYLYTYIHEVYCFKNHFSNIWDSNTDRNRGKNKLYIKTTLGKKNIQYNLNLREYLLPAIGNRNNFKRKESKGKARALAPIYASVTKSRHRAVPISPIK